MGCRFGCTHECQGREVPAPDSISHYLSCPRLAHLLALPRAIIPSGPIIRLGLGPASDYNVAREFDPISYERANYLTALAFHIYHKYRAELQHQPHLEGNYNSTMRARHAAIVALG